MDVNVNFWSFRELPPPPLEFDGQFLAWLSVMGDRLGVTFYDDTPMPSADLAELKRLQGNPPPELKFFYSRATPWGPQRPGLEIWAGHLKLIRQHMIEGLQTGGYLEKHELERVVAQSATLWPVNLSKESNSVAYTDPHGRLAILDGNIGENLGRPLALGLRNFWIMTVVAEIMWEEKNYRTYRAVLVDETVVEAGQWPKEDAPQHPLIDAYRTFHLS